MSPVDGREPEDSDVRDNAACVPVRVLPWAPTVVDRLPTVVGFTMKMKAVRAETSFAGSRPHLTNRVKHVHRSGDEKIAAKEGNMMTGGQERT